MKNSKKPLIIWLCLIAAFLILSLVSGKPDTETESLKEAMRDAVMHESGKVNIFGLVVNPALASALTVTIVLIIAAVLIRIFVISRFTMVPGRAQVVLESAVGYFSSLAREKSPYRNRLLGGYIFAAGTYIAISTLFELFGLQIVSTSGESMAMPAPLADINAAIAMGVLSYLVIVSGGVSVNGLKGLGLALKDFSLPISMSFRLFGALLSGLLVTELIYHSIYLSFVLPVAVGVMFTLLHAVIQAYVLTMLVAIFYGEVSQPSKKKGKEVSEKK